MSGAIEPALRITFKCPKCGWLYHTSHAITHLDCLGCEARVITEERAKPELKLAKWPQALGADEYGPTGNRCTPSIPSACSPQCGERGECLRAVGEYKPFDLLAELKERLPAGYSAERFDKLLDDDIAEQSKGTSPSSDTGASR